MSTTTFKAGTVTTTPSALAGGGTVTIEQDAYLLINDKTDATALDLSDGPWTVAVNGTIEADHDLTAAIRLEAHENKTNAKLTIGTEGTLYDLGFASTAAYISQATDITNSGLIHGSTYGIYIDTVSDGHKYAITNNKTGQILAADTAIYDSQNTTLTITNSGTISGGSFAIERPGLGTTILGNTGTIHEDVALGDGADKVTTSGTINGNVLLGEGNNSLTDTKATIDGTVTAGSGNDALTNSGTITSFVHLGNGNNTAANTGHLGSDISFGTGNDSLTNSGSIAGDVDFSGGTNSFTNSGTVIGVTSFGSGNDKLINSGSIGGNFLTFGGGNDTLTNTKTISADIVFGNGNDIVTNSGTFGGSLQLQDGTNAVTNKGLIYSDVTFGSGSDMLMNSGQVFGSVDLGGGGDKLTNSGHIVGTVELGAGDNSLTNSGAIDSALSCGSGNDVLTNSGTISGPVYTQGGDDKLTNTGTVTGVIDLGAGNDTFTGGTHGVTLNDSTGTDHYQFGAGNDVYNPLFNPADGIGKVDGGAGIDTYDASLQNSHYVYVNLDNTVQGTIALDFINPHVAESAQSAQGEETITNFEIVKGTNDTSHFDFLIGSSNAETFYGLDGDDVLWGGGGNDTLDGGAGKDTLRGGAGVDTLTGGGGDDVFQFDATTDSGLTRATRDVITDFEGNALSVHDVIDVSGIDANTRLANDQAFNFIGMNTAFSHTAGELHAMFQGDQTIVEGDVNGDGKADFSIAIQAHVTLAAANFDL
jgi:hypothetical protein